MMNRMKTLTLFSLSFVLIFALALILNTQGVSALTSNESWATTPWGQSNKPRTTPNYGYPQGTMPYGYPQGSMPYGYGQGAMPYGYGQGQMAPGNLLGLYFQNQQPFLQAQPQPRYSPMTTPQLINPGYAYGQFAPYGQAGYLQGAMQPYQCNSRGCQLARQNANAAGYGSNQQYNLIYDKDSKTYHFEERKAPKNRSYWGNSNANYNLVYDEKTKTYHFEQRPASKTQNQYPSYNPYGFTPYYPNGMTYYPGTQGSTTNRPYVNYAASTQNPQNSYVQNPYARNLSQTSSSYNLFQYANPYSYQLNYGQATTPVMVNPLSGQSTINTMMDDPTRPVVRPYVVTFGNH